MNTTTKVTRRIHLKQPLLPVLAILLGLLRVVTGYDGWLVLAVGLGLAWLSAYIWARSLAKGLELQRESRFGWGQVGDLVEERFKLHNHSMLPALWVEIEDQGNMPGYSGSLAMSSAGRQELTWRRSGACRQRGQFHQGPTRLRSSDVFGLYAIEIDDLHQREVLVTPPLIPLPFIDVATSGWSGEGRPRPDAPERTISAAGTRPYVPGDSLRYIHWRTSARRSATTPGEHNLHVRLFDGTPAGHWWLVLDLNASVQAGEGDRSTLETAVILAASLADRGLHNSKPVGLAAGSPVPTWIPPRAGEHQRWALLQALAVAQAGNYPLAGYLRRLPVNALKGSSIILITPDLGGTWIAELLRLTWANITPTVLLLDRPSFETTGQPAPTSPSTAACLAQLNELGVHCYPIGADLLQQPNVRRAARPGQRGQDEFRITPFGRAVRVPGKKVEEWRALE